MSPTQRLRRWGRAHPVACDAAIGVAVLVTTLLLGAPEGSRPMLVELTSSSLVLTAVACGLLSLRRRAPWQVWSTVTLLGMASTAYAGGPTHVLVPATVALYTVSSRSSTRAAAGATLVNAVVPVLITLVVGEQGVVDAFVFGLAAWNGLAAATGIAVRNQRAVVAAAHERALEAERTSEDQAQRRVAEERLRIARDLHDVVAHHVSVINVQAGVAGHLLRSDPEAAAEAMGHVREASRLVLNEVPGLLGLLRTPEDDLETAPTPGLAEIGRLVETARRADLAVTWRSSGAPVALAPGADVTAYRILQEALTNAARHGTGSADLSIAYDDRGCTLEVRNTTAGDRVSGSTSARHGIIGMTERASAVGGVLEAGPSGPDEWLVRVRLDVAAGRSRAASERS